jgi:hypothetical protein
MVSIAKDTHLLLDIQMNLLGTVAIAGDGPPLPHTPIMQFDSAVWVRFANAESN